MTCNSKTYCKKSFCVLPWIHSFVNLGGHYQVCCTGEEFNNFILGENGEKLNISDGHSIDSVMNSQYMKEFRLKLLSGELPDECTRCKVTEGAGGVSRRMVENNEYASLIDELISKTSCEGRIDFKALHVDYRLGNVCNLQCRMCNPKASRKWVDGYQKIPQKFRRLNLDKELDNFKKDPWLDNGHYIAEFKQKLKTIERLHFGGGEPLYNPHMNRTLRACVEEGRAKDIVLSYNTNLTILSDETLSLWKEFKEVKLLVSIDAFGGLNDYIRYPSKWKDIDENLRLLDDKHRDYNVSEVMVSTTVQANNILHLDKLFDYLLKFKFVKKCPNLIMLYFPSYLTPLVLPKKILSLSLLRLQSLLQRIKRREDIEPYMIQNIEQVISFLASFIKKDQVGFEDFLNFTKAYDKNNNLDISKVNPELKLYFSDLSNMD